MTKFFNMLNYSGMLICFFVTIKCSAQNNPFMPDYRFRKEITVNKAKIDLGTSGKHTNFMLLVQVQDPAFIYDENAFENKLTSSQGLDISFADKASSKVPLKFQLESYDPVNGRIVCWVMIPVLWSRDGAGENKLFIYYGSNILHDPQHPDVINMWQAEYHTIQHFNEDADGKIHSARHFNGISDQLEVAAHDDRVFTFSAWIKLNNVGKEQMIATNDSLGIGGYQIKINSDNKLVFAVQNLSMPRPYISTSTLDVNVWYHISISLNNNVVLFFINGKSEFSLGGGNYTAGSPGKVKIGASKQGDQFFDGIIDELSIKKIARIKGWIIATYENQQDPASFFTFGSNETNPDMGELTYTFAGSGTSNWATARNWVQFKTPGIASNVKILAGVVAEIKGNVQVNKLLMEQGAQLILHADLQLSGNLKLESGAVISSTGTTKLQLHGDVLNHGHIVLTGAASKLTFSGNKTSILYEGNGAALTSMLEINQQPGAIVEMNTLLKVKKSVQVVNGILAAKGNLLLLADALNTAGVYPLGASADITGNVQVQNFVSTYEAPATGRGWRLLSAPVIYNSFPASNASPFIDVKKSMFVTGSGGAVNGFDESPRNGVTIYTHDQSLAGTLVQKYVPISSVNMPLQIGKGFFAYSRGNRLLPDAYQHQIQGSPFLNATSYVITYTGPLFKGDLYVDVFNADRGEEGDGFNLLGNPYAAPIRWGSLHKVNVGPYVWLFDPLNNTYRVSMDPDEIIPAGAGFFIKVDSNFKSGRVGFTEASKIL